MGPIWGAFHPETSKRPPLGGRSHSEPIAPQQLTKVTRAGLEPATYGLKGRPEFILRGRTSTSKFVPLHILALVGVRSRFSEFWAVLPTSRDNWGATGVQPAWIL